MPKPARKRDPAAARRAILSAAAELLVEGDGHLEMSWVAKAAGVSQGLAYHHFGSKEGLLEAVVNDFYDRVDSAALMARIDEIEGWEAREIERVGRYIDFLINDPLGVVIITRLASTPAVAAVEAQRWDALVSVGARNMAEGQRSGAVAAPENPELLAAMVLGAVRAAVARAIAEGKTLQGKKLAREIWAFARRGLQVED